MDARKRGPKPVLSELPPSVHPKAFDQHRRQRSAKHQNSWKPVK